MAMKRVIIAGGRDFKGKKLLFNKVGWWYGMMPGAPEILVVSGKAPGADKLGENWADYMGFSVYPFRADWRPDGPDGPMDKAAGCKRNVLMAKFADVLLAFWDGKSKGTKHMINEALKNGLEVHVWKY